MIVVTGGSSGIGHALATMISSSNSQEDLYLISRRNPGVEGCKWLNYDISDVDQINMVIHELKQINLPISLMVHCAGTMRTCPSHSLDPKEYIASLTVNCVAPITITSQLIKQLAMGKGLAIAISSIASDLSIPGELIYSSSKSALRKGFENLSADLSRLGCSFVTISPCMMDTPMTAGLTPVQKEFMNSKRSTLKQPQPHELAEFILMLAKAPSFITGSDILFGGIKK